jgi:HSP20 family protein
VDPTEIHVVAAERVLVVSGERRRAELHGRYQQMELEYGVFERRISLAEPVDAAAATARYENGLLTVELPIAAQPRPRDRVTITIVGRA